MVSKKSWERFKREVEGLTKTGVEKELWGKRFRNKDSSDCLLWKRRKSAPPGHSFKGDDDIKGFSSSEEDEPRVICKPAKTCSSDSRRDLRRSVTVRKRKQQKTHSVPDVKDPSPVESSCHYIRDPHGAKHMEGGLNKWKDVSGDFDNSFTVHTPSPVFHLAHSCLSVATSGSKYTFERNEERNESEDIAWSDSDSEQIAFDVDAKSLDRQFQKTPLSARYEEPIHQEEKAKHVGDIDEFDSDTEERDISMESTLDKKSSPSISPNTPTPTPFSPKGGEIEGCPPLDSAKKKKPRYLRTGLAERLRKLLMRESSEKSFWFHKLRQRKESHDDEDQSSRQGDGTLTLRVVSEDLDHSVHVIKCEVISQDVISERRLPDQVIVLMDKEIWKQTDMKSAPSYLRIYSPWKRFDLPNSSLPVLLCITHCEALSVLSSYLQTISKKTAKVLPLRNSKQFDQQLTKNVRTRLFASPIRDNKKGDMSINRDEDNDEQEIYNMNESTAETSKEIPTLHRSLMDSMGLQGQCLKSRIDFTARIQRVYWRNLRKRNWILNCSSSSLVRSIIEHSRILEESNMSFCFLAQDSTGFCCEIQIPSNVLLRKTEWHELLWNVEGSVMLFRGLRLAEHRKRKRRIGVFAFIDSLAASSSGECSAAEEISKRSPKQNVCFALSIDDSTFLQRLSDEEVNGHPSYNSPSTLTTNDLENNRTFGHKRVKLYGRLLHTTFKTNQRYDTKDIRLFILTVTDSEILASDSFGVSEELSSDFVIQVRYSSGRSVGWNESELSAGQLLYMQDLVIEKGNSTILTADTYSKIQVLISRSTLSPSSRKPASNIDDLWRQTMSASVDGEMYSRLRRHSRTVLPKLNADTERDNLVSFEGIIIDVDQENAFCWFTCNECGSDDISEFQENSLYICNSCALDIRSPLTNTHLEVYLKSLTSPALCVKVKLLQSTISRLLPASDRSDEGYDVQCILNKRLGPMSCYVLTKQDDKDRHDNPKISFKLEEIDSDYQTVLAHRLYSLTAMYTGDTAFKRTYLRKMN